MDASNIPFSAIPKEIIDIVSSNASYWEQILHYLQVMESGTSQLNQPNQSPCEKNPFVKQTKDILVTVGEEYKRVITLRNHEGMQQLSKTLVKYLEDETFYKNLIDSSTLRYHSYSELFHQWIEINNLEQFILSDGMKLKVVLTTEHVVNNNAEMQVKEEKYVHNNKDESKDIETNLTSEDDITNVDNETKQTYQKENSQSNQYVQVEPGNTYMSANSTNFFYELKLLMKCILENNSSEENVNTKSLVSKASTSDSQSENTMDNQETVNCPFNLTIPFETRIFMNQYSISNHPMQYLCQVAVKLLWEKPEYELVSQIRQRDNSWLFLYSIKIGEHKLVAEVGGKNKKIAKRLAAENCLKKLGFI